MQQDNFYLTLLSNSCFSSFPDNKTNSFKVHLTKEIKLDGSWHVCLSEIIYPSTLFNISEKNNKIIMTYKYEAINLFTQTSSLTTKNLEIEIEPGFYSTIQDVIARINEQFSAIFACNLFNEKLTSSNHATIVSSDVLETVEEKFENSEEFETTFVYINEGNVESPQFGELNIELEIRLEGRLSLQLGFTPDQNIYKFRTSPFPVSLDLGIPSELFCYIDIVEPQLISSACSQIIKIVKTVDKNTSFGDTINREILNRSYVSLNRHSFQTVSIEFRDSTGEFINFLFGTSILQLHFKKKANK